MHTCQWHLVGSRVVVINKMYRSIPLVCHLPPKNKVIIWLAEVLCNSSYSKLYVALMKYKHAGLNNFEAKSFAHDPHPYVQTCHRWSFLSMSGGWGLSNISNYISCVSFFKQWAMNDNNTKFKKLKYSNLPKLLNFIGVHPLTCQTLDSYVGTIYPVRRQQEVAATPLMLITLIES